MLLDYPNKLDHTRAAIRARCRPDEHTIILELLKNAHFRSEEVEAIQKQAIALITKIRGHKNNEMSALFTRYALNSEEGIALLCLSEALLRIPDNSTSEKLINDKLGSLDWQSSSYFDYTALGLRLTSKILVPENIHSILNRSLFKLIKEVGGKFIYETVKRTLNIASKQFVAGSDINEALAITDKMANYRFSYDLLGEAAITMEDSERYFNAYKNAIGVIGAKISKDNSNIYANPGISIKLSALHPRYEEAQRKRVLKELSPKLLFLAQAAKQFNLSLTIDAEESERLELSLDLIENIFFDQSLDGWNGFGIAVQTYQKRAIALLDWVGDLAKHRPLMVRLLKGAYWDSEIKKAQIQGVNEYPVFTYKAFTDVSFQACAKKLLSLCPQIYPQFATHNAYSVAMILNLVDEECNFEFQRLYGMGGPLFNEIIDSRKISCRVYTPVGKYQELLPYLVRRLLENGANSSFVNNLNDLNITLNHLVKDPVAEANSLLGAINKNIPLPLNIFHPERNNSQGFDFNDRTEVFKLQQYYAKYDAHEYEWSATPIIANYKDKACTNSILVRSPQNTDLIIGKASYANFNDVNQALEQAEQSFLSWGKKNLNDRIKLVENFANLLADKRAELLRMLCLEAGKTFVDADAEIREAIDYCGYYNAQARILLANPKKLLSYTGETNQLTLHPRGVVLAISPWNFPLAIFTGQIIAALIMGNCVIAKPATDTSLIAAFVVKLMHKAGIPTAVVQLLLGSGKEIGNALVADLRVKAVVFTGGLDTANSINQTLAKRSGEIIPLVAETGGLNAMIVDSSALLEQTVTDVLTSAFGSAGQRCSALRVLFVQEEIYVSLLTMLQGAMRELNVGDPSLLKTDLGPLINKNALESAKEHVNNLSKEDKIIYQCKLNQSCQRGFFMPPTVIEIPNLAILKKETFAPILHVIKFQANAIDDVIKQINNTGFGLTLGIQSRINTTIDYIRQHANVGNCYVNRNMIGAVVGVQPFGGEGLSGTGPKAGGPYYLLRFCKERTFTVNTTAAGGNASLLCGDY